jgi:hypothetical protein
MARERGQLLARCPVPELHRSIVTAGGDDLAVPRKCHGLDRRAVSRQCDKFLARSRLPHFGGAVVAGRRDVHAVGRIGQTAQRQGVSLQDDAGPSDGGQGERDHHEEPAKHWRRQNPGPSL